MRRTPILLCLIIAIMASPVLWIRYSPAPLCTDATSAEPDAWQRGAAMPTARSELASTTLDGRIYVAGGLRTAGGTTAFERFDVASNTWEQLAPLPVALHHLGLAAVNGQVYATGGYADLTMAEISAETYRYNPQADQWETVAPMPSPRAAHITLAHDNKLYVIGGVGVGSTFLWAYDARNDSWEAIPATPSAPREHLAGAVVDDKLIAIGGRWNGKNVATVEIFDLTNQRWTVGAPMPTARGGLAAAAINGSVHVVGGEAFEPCVFVEHEVYDVANNRWVSASNMPQGRHGLTASAVDDTLFVIGGATKATIQTLFTYTARVDSFLIKE